jgi:hypothetical protein
LKTVIPLGYETGALALVKTAHIPIIELNLSKHFWATRSSVLSRSAEFEKRMNNRMTMRTPSKPNPRAEFRRLQIERANNSVSLGEKFPKLKSLTVELAYFDSDGLTRTGELRYKVNVNHARSVFSFTCPCGECMGGDFDLSDAVAEAVNARRKVAEGEIRCQGWRTRPKQEKVPCRNLMRYKLTLQLGRG